MASGDLIPSNHDRSEPASTEVQFALVIARMIDTVKNSPEHMRQAVYDLARDKLQEQFTYADAKDIRRTQQALESAIRGVEEFSKQQVGIPATAPPGNQRSRCCGAGASQRRSSGIDPPGSSATAFGDGSRTGRRRREGNPSSMAACQASGGPVCYSRWKMCGGSA